MPNWCNTRIQIRHEDPQKTRELYESIKKWMTYDYHKNGFGLTWLGNIVGNSGVDRIREKGDFEKVRCRGWVSYIEYVEDIESILIDTETAWRPMLQMWQLVCDRYLPGAEIVYEAQECGCCLYQTNDPALKDCYVLDAMDSDLESDWEVSEEVLRRTIQEECHTEETDMEKLLEILNNSSVGAAAYKWDWIPIEDQE